VSCTCCEQGHHQTTTTNIYDNNNEEVQTAPTYFATTTELNQSKLLAGNIRSIIVSAIICSKPAEAI
jgi:hypothetical protein